MQLTLLGVFAAAGAATATAEAMSDVDWANHGNDKGRSRYSPLSQINRDNVARLQVAWTYHTGDMDIPAEGSIDGNGGTSMECTPVVIAGTMFVTTPRGRVVALDAATGREKWKFNPWPGLTDKAGGHGYQGFGRGVSYWPGTSTRGARVVLGTTDGRLILLDAASGVPDEAFGTKGVVNLRQGIVDPGAALQKDPSGMVYGLSAPPGIYRNLAIIGVMVGERIPSAPGDIRAFNLLTGEEVWRFHTVPRKGEVGNETWEGDSWKARGGANPWSGVTVDEKRGFVFAGLGSAAYDFYGGDRKGNNLFANSIVALNAMTGNRIWHHQLIHHDVWDYDLAAAPTLVSVERKGKKIDAVVQTIKSGFIYVFERDTGKPVFDIIETPVPTSTDVPGEWLSPTQPMPVSPPPLSRQGFSPDDITNISAESRAHVLGQLKGLNYGPLFTPPSLRGTVWMPGFYGGVPWSGSSFDPTTGLLYVNTNDLPKLLKLVPSPPGSPLPYGGVDYAPFTDHEGYPAISPPWGNLTAINLNTGEIAWRSTLGEYPELIARGLSPTGTENLGGTIVTAGGLVFIAATKDELFRAFDKTSGKELWRYKLPAAGIATPSTYSVNNRQYVVIAAGGAPRLNSKPGDAFVTFALP